MTLPRNTQSMRAMLYVVCVLALRLVYANDVAFVIPVHPPKFNHMAVFLRSYNMVEGVNADVVSVFTTMDDLATFTRIHESDVPKTGFRPLVYNGSEAKLNIYPVFYKKWWAVRTLLSDYTFFFLVDAEIKIVKKFDARDIASAIYFRKILYGTETLGEPYLNVNERSMYGFSDNDKQRLRVINKNNTIYFWYNEIPVVEAASARRYLNYVGFSTEEEGIAYETQGGSIRPFDGSFDFVSYAYYCLLYEDFALLEVGYLGQHIGASFGEEGGGSSTLLRVTKPHWAFEGAWLESRSKFDQSNIVLLFHCDRHNRRKP